MSLLKGIGFLCKSAGEAFLLGTGGLEEPLGLLPGSSPLNHFWKNDFLSIDPALPLANVGEFGLGILFTAPTPAPTLTPGKFCLGGVEGLTGLGKLFLLEKEVAAESKLLGDMDTSAGEGQNIAAGPAWACAGNDDLQGHKHCSLRLIIQMEKHKKN